uniref:L1 transposable element RRM domain-containing protein n=1 Tax=Amphilophus citrinellus TaxID=61819 RepID=A0A3Q0RYJ6_AMPCI
MGKDNKEKLSAIHAELASLTAGLGSIRSDMDKLKTSVESNASVLDCHNHAFQELELKLADMEDRNRRCNIRIIGLKEGLEGSNATQYLTSSLPKWFPALAHAQIEIMRAHRIYSDARNRGVNRTLIFNVLCYTTRQAILRAVKKSPLTIDGRKIRFSPDYSNFTVKRRQAFHQAMDAAHTKGLDFFLLYPATLKIKEGTEYRSFTSSKEAEDYVAAVTPPALAQPLQETLIFHTINKSHCHLLSVFCVPSFSTS